MSSSSKLQSGQGDLFGETLAVVKPQKAAPPEPCPLCANGTETYLSDRQVALRYDISKATVWRWHDNNPDFPRRIKLSAGVSRWKLSDLCHFETKRQNAVAPPEVRQTKGQRT